MSGQVSELETNHEILLSGDPAELDSIFRTAASAQPPRHLVISSVVGACSSRMRECFSRDMKQKQKYMML